jgi:hypothetical protein
MEGINRRLIINRRQRENFEMIPAIAFTRERVWLQSKTRKRVWLQSNKTVGMREIGTGKSAPRGPFFGAGPERGTPLLSTLLDTSLRFDGPYATSQSNARERLGEGVPEPRTSAGPGRRLPGGALVRHLGQNVLQLRRSHDSPHVLASVACEIRQLGIPAH